MLPITPSRKGRPEDSNGCGRFRPVHVANMCSYGAVEHRDEDGDGSRPPRTAASTRRRSLSAWASARHTVALSRAHARTSRPTSASRAGTTGPEIQRLLRRGPQRRPSARSGSDSPVRRGTPRGGAAPSVARRRPRRSRSSLVVKRRGRWALEPQAAPPGRRAEGAALRAMRDRGMAGRAADPGPPSRRTGTTATTASRTSSLLCPNCHSQTENFAGRNVGGAPAPSEPRCEREVA